MRSLILSAAFLSAAFMLGCQDQGLAPVGLDGVGIMLDKEQLNHTHGGGDKGGGGGGEKATWSFAKATEGTVGNSAATLISSCLATPGSNDTHPTLVWPRHGMCANITPAGQNLNEPTISLTDDPRLDVQKKGGQIVAVTFRAQDVIGADGIQYESEEVPIEPPQTFTGAGFRLSINVSGVNVWQLKGHTGGPRVRSIGTMNFGEIVYQ